VIRFRFALAPLDQVAAWGRESPELHWFGLTEGWYWIELAGTELLRYSPETLQLHRGDGPGAHHPYVDHYVARLWEDLGSLSPAVLQPVPADLLEFIASEPEDWTADSSTPDGDLSDILLEDDAALAAVTWYDGHVLDLGYLRQPPRIRAWRTVGDDVDIITLTWRHSDDGDIRFAADPFGSASMPSTSFLDAVRELDHDLMLSMAERIGELERAGPAPGVRLDLDRLRAEHLDRMAWLGRRLRAEPATGWDEIRAGARHLLAR
jgi:hypothetical protein